MEIMMTIKKKIEKQPFTLTIEYAVSKNLVYSKGHIFICLTTDLQILFIFQSASY